MRELRERGCATKREREREKARGGGATKRERVRDGRYKKRDTERDGGTREKGGKREGQKRGAKRGKGQEESRTRGGEQDEKERGKRETEAPIPRISSDFIGQKSIKIFLNQCKAFVTFFLLSSSLPLHFPQFSIENTNVYIYSFLLLFFSSRNGPPLRFILHCD